MIKHVIATLALIASFQSFAGLINLTLDSSHFVAGSQQLNLALVLENAHKYRVLGGTFSALLVDDFDPMTESVSTSSYNDTGQERRSGPSRYHRFERNQVIRRAEADDRVMFQSAGSSAIENFEFLSGSTSSRTNLDRTDRDVHTERHKLCWFGCWTYTYHHNEYYTNVTTYSHSQEVNKRFSMELNELDIQSIQYTGSFDFSLTSLCAECDLFMQDVSLELQVSRDVPAPAGLAVVGLTLLGVAGVRRVKK